MAEKKNFDLVTPEELAAIGGWNTTAGLRCSVCGCGDFRVIETDKRGGAIVRRRACRRCGKRVTTRENIVK